MPKHNPETLESVISHHRPNATNNIQIAPIPTGKFNDSYFVLADNEPLVLRIAPPRNAVFCFYEKDMMRQEPDIHLLLQKKQTSRSQLSMPTTTPSPSSITTTCSWNASRVPH